MNAIFFSIWIDGRIMGPPAVQKALDQIDAVHENVSQIFERHRSAAPRKTFAAPTRKTKSPR